MPLHRRTFVGTTVSLSMAAIAGCSGATDRLSDAAGGGESQRLKDQKAVVDRFIAGINGNDIGAVNGTVGKWARGGFTEKNIGEYTFERDELRRTESEDYDATLETELSITHDGESRTDRASFRLAKTGDGWVIHELKIIGGFFVGGTTLNRPMVFLGSSYDGDATSSGETGVLTIRHESEAVVPASGLSIHGTITDPEGAGPDITTDGATVQEATGNDRFSSGDTLTIGVEHEYEVSVQYSKAGVDEIVLLTDFSGP
jgi:hypothetical protein